MFLTFSIICFVAIIFYFVILYCCNNFYKLYKEKATYYWSTVTNYPEKRIIKTTVFNQWLCVKGLHCKLTRRRSSNSIDITGTTLWPCCSSSSDFTHKYERVDWKHIKFQYFVEFTLVWRDLTCYLNFSLSVDHCLSLHVLTYVLM